MVQLIRHLDERTTSVTLFAAYRCGPYSGAFELRQPDPVLEQHAAEQLQAYKGLDLANRSWSSVRFDRPSGESLDV